MKNIKYFSLLAFLLITLSSCKKEALLSGKIEGFVTLMDDYGYPAEDQSGTLVEIEGVASATTNEKGKYTLSNVAAGYYELKLSKDSFGYTSQKIMQVGGNVPAYMGKDVLYKIPSYNLKTIDISSGDHSIMIRGELSELTSYYIRAYLNDSANVSPDNFDYFDEGVTSCYNSTQGDQRNCFESSNYSYEIYLYNYNYEVGDTVYLVLYVYNPYEYGTNYSTSFGYLGQSGISSAKKASNVLTIVLE